MDLFEYQARDMFEAHGVPVLAGIVAHTPEEAKAAAEKIGGVTVGGLGRRRRARLPERPGADRVRRQRFHIRRRPALLPPRQAAIS